MDSISQIKLNTKKLTNEAVLAKKLGTDLSVSDFAAKHRKMSPEDNPKNSAMFIAYPHQVEMMNVILEKDIQRVVIKSSTQIGKTAILQALLLYFIANRNGGILLMLPSQEMARDFSKSRISPLIRDCKILHDLIPPDRKHGNNILQKNYKSGYLKILGSTQADKIAGSPVGIIFCDEVSRFVASSTSSKGNKEGNPIFLLDERNKEFPDDEKVFVATSTPTIKGLCEIDRLYEEGDQRLAYTPCPHCGFEQFLFWEHFEWDGKDKKLSLQKVDPTTIRFRCQGCHKTFVDSDFKNFPPDVRWVAQDPERGKINNTASFHINAFYTNPWVTNFKKYLKTENDIDALMVFTNTTLGVAFENQAITPPDWQKLYSHTKRYSYGAIPHPYCFLTAACDVQENRIECTTVAHFRDRLAVISHDILIGNTGDIDDPVYIELEDLVRRKWKHESGANLMIEKVAIDSNYHRNNIFTLAKRNKKFLPVRGVNNFDQIVLPPKAATVNRNGRKCKGSKYYPLGVSLIKSDLYARLKLEVEIDSKGNYSFPSKYIEFPRGLSEEYFKQLVSEILVRSNGTRYKMKWESNYHAHETLDTLVYNIGLSHILGLPRWTDKRWELLSNAVKYPRKKRTPKKKSKSMLGEL